MSDPSAPISRPVTATAAPDRAFRQKVVQAALIVAAIVAIMAVMWKLTGVVLMIFGAAVIAVLIDTAARPFRRLGLGYTPSIFAGLLASFALIGVIGYWFGNDVAAQAEAVQGNIARAIPAVQSWVEQRVGPDAFSKIAPAPGTIVSRLISFGSGTFGLITNAVVLLIGAIYLALDPSTYVRGFAKLFPRHLAHRVQRALVASGEALRRTLLGQFVTMIVNAILTMIGLSLIGMPSAVALGVILGLCNFVPMIGPFIGAIPGLLIALTLGPKMLMWTAIVYLVVQQFEGNVLTPMVQKRAVNVPPALLIFLLAGFGILFGIPGTLLAAPMAVVLYVLVASLWSRDTLGHKVDLPPALDDAADRYAGREDDGPAATA